MDEIHKRSFCILSYKVTCLADLVSFQFFFLNGTGMLHKLYNNDNKLCAHCIHFCITHIFIAPAK